MSVMKSSGKKDGGVSKKKTVADGMNRLEAAKKVEVTNAALKGNGKDADVMEDASSQSVEKGNTKQKVVSLLNVYMERATAEDQKRTSAILGFFKNLWSSIQSFFGRKEKEPATPIDLNKEDVLEKLVEVFQCADNLADIAADEALMHRIMTELPAAERNAALDCLYDQVSSVDMLIEMIDLRFGVTVVDSRPETLNGLDETTKKLAMKYSPIDWASAGLVHVYKVYIHLPQSDLDLIKCLMHRDDKNVGGAALGYTNGTTGIYWVNYVKGKEDMQEIVNPALDGQGRVSGHSDHSSDRRNGTIMMDMTTAHELGHVVDGHSGWKLSGPGSSMRSVSKWQETPDDPKTVVQEMMNSISGVPYDGALSGDELEVTKRVGVKYLQQDQDTFGGKWSAASDFIKTETEKVVNDSGNSSIDSESLGKKLVSQKYKTNLLRHLWRGQGVNSSHYNHNDAMSGMSRPFHQGYKGEPWFTFDLSAWNDKISCYQFRCPKEEFAETYASYHAAPAMGKKKGEMTPKGLLDWFIAQGLGENIPETGTSEIKEDKKS